MIDPERRETRCRCQLWEIWRLPADQVRGEAEALAAWRARGVVELVACDVPRGALLLERLVEADIADAVCLASGNGRDEEQADTWAG